jgi:uncharacterized membrane protein YedE/YeeE
MIELLREPWPWYVAGPLIGLVVPALLLAGNKLFGISASLRTLCAVIAPGKIDFFHFDWRRVGGWNLAFALGILIGAVAAATLLGGTGDVAISPATHAALAELGVRDFGGLVPDDLFSWRALTSPAGLVMIVVGGFLVGLGAAWGGGCTSGHAIMGLANGELPSLIAVLGFFAGGLVATHLLLPLLLGGVP